jgi:hypothetical protein
MRTTLTLDPDVAAMLKKEMRQQKATLKETINRALRMGLQAAEAQPAQAPYRIKPWNTGPFLINIDDVSEALILAEGEDHK